MEDSSAADTSKEQCRSYSCLLQGVRAGGQAAKWTPAPVVHPFLAGRNLALHTFSVTLSKAIVIDIDRIAFLK